MGCLYIGPIIERMFQCDMWKKYTWYKLLIFYFSCNLIFLFFVTGASTTFMLLVNIVESIRIATAPYGMCPRWGINAVSILQCHGATAPYGMFPRWCITGMGVLQCQGVTVPYGMHKCRGHSAVPWSDCTIWDVPQVMHKCRGRTAVPGERLLEIVHT